MPRDITITFSDGTKHQYNNTPDSVTPDDIEKRAKKDYPTKKISNISGGKKKPAGDPLSADPISANARPKDSTEPVKKKDELDQVKKNAGIPAPIPTTSKDESWLSKLKSLFTGNNYMTSKDLVKLDPGIEKTPNGKILMRVVDQYNGKLFCLPKMNDEQMMEKMTSILFKSISDPEDLINKIGQKRAKELWDQDKPIESGTKLALVAYFPCQ